MRKKPKARAEAILVFCDNQRATRCNTMIAEPKGPRVGAKAPEFFIATADGRLPLHQLAGRHKKLVLTTQDSYRYHPN